MKETETPEVFGPVSGDVAAVEAAIRFEIAQDPAEVARPMSELFEAGGKRLRPALVMLSAMCGKYDRVKLLPAAMAVELTHAATLVHDDVIDRSPVRRGKPTIAASLGDEPAIVIGDYYFAKAYELAARTKSISVVATLARSVMAICAGEVRQQAIRYRYSTDVDEYIGRIAAKTAILLGACCDIGARLGGVRQSEHAALVAYGELLGIAFQIADDVLDYTSAEHEVGKPIGHDILEGFATLPFMLSSIHIEDGRRLTESEARQVVEEVRAGKGPELALDQARAHAERARDQLKALGDSAALDALTALTGYVVNRKL